MIYKQPRKKKTVRYKVKLKAAAAVNHFLSAFALFISILFITLFFILFQWKNVKIHSHLVEIDKLNQEILALNSELSRLETIRNELIRQVPEVAQRKLKMITPREAPKKLVVPARKLARYAKED
jgi:hypothetical protein